MRKGFFVLIGASLIIAGFFYLLNFASGLTGLVIFDNLDENMSAFAGIWFVVSGIVVMYASRYGK